MVPPTPRHAERKGIFGTLIGKKFLMPGGQSAKFEDMLRHFSPQVLENGKSLVVTNSLIDQMRKKTGKGWKEIWNEFDAKRMPDSWEYRQEDGYYYAICHAIDQNAREKGISFNEALLQYAKEISPAAYHDIRILLIGNREIDASDEDAQELVNRLKEDAYGGAYAIASAMRFDAKRTAALMAILHPELFRDDEALYHIVTKLVSGRVKIKKGGSALSDDPLDELKDLARNFDTGLLRGDRGKMLLDLCFKEAEERYLKSLVLNPEHAFERLRNDLAEEKNESVRLILAHVLAYYSEIHEFKIEGAKETIFNRTVGAETPFPSVHQKIGIKGILKDKRLLVADEMGVGKTAQALLAFVELCNREPDKGHKALVVAPVNVMDHWEKHIAECLTPGYYEKFKPVRVRSGNKEKSLMDAKDAKIVLINYDLVIRSLNGKSQLYVDEEAGEEMSSQDARTVMDALTGLNFTYVVLDEVHNTKNPNYMSRPTDAANRYLRACKDGKKRLLISCPPDEIPLWAKEMSALLALDSRKFAVLGGENGTMIADASSADVVIATERTAQRLAESENFDLLYDPLELREHVACQRSMLLHRLLTSGGAEYAVLLSGTPLPNRLSDIGNMASMLEPWAYPNATLFNKLAEKDHRLIHELLGRRMLRRRLDDVINLPELEVNTVEVVLPEEQRLVYQMIQDNDFDVLAPHKLVWTRHAAINPQVLYHTIDPRQIAARLLLDESQVARLEELRQHAKAAPAAKYGVLREIVRKEMAEGNAIVVFASVLTDGIVSNAKGWDVQTLPDYLKESGIRCAYIDGTVERGKNGRRESIYRAFQEHGEFDVLAATVGTMGEGVPLTRASVVITLDYPYTYDELRQAIARLHRVGQNKAVRVYHLKALGTIDENAERLIGEKRRISQLVIDGIRTTHEENSLFNDLTKSRARSPKGDILTVPEGPFGDALLTPGQQLLNHYHAMNGRGKEHNSLYLRLHGRSYADLYLYKWETAYHGNTIRAVTRLIDSIEKSAGRRLETIADLASGPAMLTRASGRKTICIDMNPHVLEKAQKDFPGLVETRTGFLDELSLESGSCDLALISLAFHYAPHIPKPGEAQGERERIMREALRVLKPGGWLILAELPHYLNEEGTILLGEGLRELGAEVNPGLMGIARDAADGNSFQTFLLAARKVSGAPSGPLGRPDYFVLNTEHDIVYIGGGTKRLRKKPAVDMLEGRKVEQFVFETLSKDTVPLEDACSRAEGFKGKFAVRRADVIRRAREKMLAHSALDAETQDMLLDSYINSIESVSSAAEAKYRHLEQIYDGKGGSLADADAQLELLYALENAASARMEADFDLLVARVAKGNAKAAMNISGKIGKYAERTVSQINAIGEETQGKRARKVRMGSSVHAHSPFSAKIPKDSEVASR